MKDSCAARRRWRISRSYSRARRAGATSPGVAAPAMTPASTNGLRLLGRATTRAGTPKGIASIAAVELAVTSAAATPVSWPSPTDSGAITTLATPWLASTYGRAPSAGCGLITRRMSGIAAAAFTSASKASPSCTRLAATTTMGVSSPAPSCARSEALAAASKARADVTMPSSRALPVTARLSAGKCARASRCSRVSSSKMSVRSGRGKPWSAGLAGDGAISSGSCR